MILDVIIGVVLIDIAVSLRRLLIGGTTYGTTWFPWYPLDWPYLISKWWWRRG